MKKKKHSNKVIHVTIGWHPMASIRGNNAYPVSTSSKSVFQQSPHSVPSFKVKKRSNIQSAYSLPTNLMYDKTNSIQKVIGKGSIIDYHKAPKQKKKIQRTQKISIVIVITSLLVLLSLIVILSLLLIKKGTDRLPVKSIPILRWNTTGITIAGVLNKPDSTNNQLYFPFDIALDYMNNLYVADRFNNRTQKFLFGDLTGQTVAGNLTANATPTQLFFPSGVTVDSNQNLYIVDTYNHRAVYWSQGASFGIRIGGSIPNPTNTFSTPYGISLDPISNTLYIVDRYNYRIMSFKSIWSNGTLVVGGSNGPGPNRTELSLPFSLHFDYVSNSLIVSNTNTNNIIRYVIGADSYTRVAGYPNGSAGVTSTSLNNPVGVTIDPMGHIYVADGFNNRIQFFDYDGSNGTTIAGFSGLGNDNATILNIPRAVRLDSQLNLYVADTGHHRIQKFLRY